MHVPVNNLLVSELGRIDEKISLIAMASPDLSGGSVNGSKLSKSGPRGRIVRRVRSGVGRTLGV